MVVEEIAKELNVTDGGSGYIGIGKVPWEKDKGDVTDIFRVCETRKMSDLERGFSCGVEDLGSALYGWEATGINEFL